jgi:hypothetical protein
MPAEALAAEALAANPLGATAPKAHDNMAKVARGLLRSGARAFAAFGFMFSFPGGKVAKPSASAALGSAPYKSARRTQGSDGQNERPPLGATVPKLRMRGQRMFRQDDQFGGRSSDIYVFRPETGHAARACRKRRRQLGSANDPGDQREFAHACRKLPTRTRCELPETTEVAIANMATRQAGA